ncbi:hypothetical protein PHMEG_00010255 [Phytophthora megakarya]|uniref:Uncharacterized protein n=1 Tax=Phytophthora megakarya TaxID=4795 RepID=A0A225WE47_9STRA|nr:hypothetical protein PHMEG_00010255 [Phytophthora megakarya]
MQPMKSCFIFLNKAVAPVKWHGLPVLQDAHTIKYLGQDIGFGYLSTSEILVLLINMQKQFIWRKHMKDDLSRHKMAPT